MELSHGKSWSFVALLIALVSLLLFYYGELYAVVGVFVSFMGLILMSVVYYNLYMIYEDGLSIKEERERSRLLDEEMSSLMSEGRDEKDDKQET
jgi:hypothetical protein